MAQDYCAIDKKILADYPKVKNKAITIEEALKICFEPEGPKNVAQSEYKLDIKVFYLSEISARHSDNDILLDSLVDCITKHGSLKTIFGEAVKAEFNIFKSDVLRRALIKKTPASELRYWIDLFAKNNIDKYNKIKLNNDLTPAEWIYLEKELGANKIKEADLEKLFPACACVKEIENWISDQSAPGDLPKCSNRLDESIKLHAKKYEYQLIQKKLAKIKLLKKCDASVSSSKNSTNSYQIYIYSIFILFAVALVFLYWLHFKNLKIININNVHKVGNDFQQIQQELELIKSQHSKTLNEINEIKHELNVLKTSKFQYQAQTSNPEPVNLPTIDKKPVITYFENVENFIENIWQSPTENLYCFTTYPNNTVEFTININNLNDNNPRNFDSYFNEKYIDGIDYININLRNKRITPGLFEKTTHGYKLLRRITIR